MINVITAAAQGVSNYNLYTVNQYAINPAYTGSQYGLFTMLHFKNHLAGINNSPRNVMFVVHSPVGERLGLGGNLTVGQAGIFRNTIGNVAASYRVTLSPEHEVTFGLSSGFQRTTIDMDELSNTDLSDPTLQTTGNVYYNFGYGAVYKWNSLEVSLAFPNAVQQEDQLLKNYFIGMTSCKIATADEQFLFQPSILYKALPASKSQVDLYLQTQWKSMLWGLVGYRTNKNMIVGAGLMLDNNLDLGYSYEIPSGTKTLSKGTHEVVLSFVFNKKAPPAKAKKSDLVLLDSAQRHIKELEAEVLGLRQQVGELSKPIIVDSVRLSQDLIFSFDANNKFQKIHPGNYVVIQTCSTPDFADRMVKMYRTKGINTFKIYNQTQKTYYIVEKYFPSFDDAKFEMQKMRSKGYKNCFVMEY